MTVIVKMRGTVSIEKAFPLLNITRLDLPPPLRPTKKYKIPYCGIPGAILSAKYRNYTRGIVKSKTSRSFLNSVTLDICTSKKNINAKLSGGIIQMCGPDSEALARETAQHIIEHLLNVQKELDYINEHSEERDISIQWLIDNTVGKDYIIDADTQEIIKLDEDEIINEDGNITKNGETLRLKEIEVKFSEWHEGDYMTDENIICDKHGIPYIIVSSKGDRQRALFNFNFFIKIELDSKGEQIHLFVGKDGKPIKIVSYTPVKVIEVKSISIPSHYPDSYPEGIDQRIVNFYIKYAPDFAYHHVFTQFLESVKDIDNIVSEDLCIEKINMAMINYSYSLGMAIDRWKLANCIQNLNGFKARYCNSTDHSVTISLPYELSEEERGSRRKNKPTRHTFMVHKSGIVTQSGPNIDLMRGAYYRFMVTINQIRKDIIQKNKPFNLKYRPVFPENNK